MGKKNQGKQSNKSQSQNNSKSNKSNKNSGQTPNSQQQQKQQLTQGMNKKQLKQKQSSYSWSDTPEYIHHIAKFNEQLKQYNTIISDVIGDGNCLFRAFANILDGNENEHAKYREIAVKEMKKNVANYKPFVFDITYESYLNEISVNKNWAGNLELQALSNALNLTCFVHMLERPIMIIKPNNYIQKIPTIHIAYHFSEDIPEHYSAIRNIADVSSQSALPIKHPIFVGLESKILQDIKEQNEFNEKLLQSKKDQQNDNVKNQQKKQQSNQKNCQQNDQQKEKQKSQQQKPEDVEQDTENQSSQQSKEEEEQKKVSLDDNSEQEKSKQQAICDIKTNADDINDINNSSNENNQDQFDYPRNKKCYCGSFLPYKKCCMKLLYKQKAQQNDLIQKKGAVIL